MPDRWDDERIREQISDALSGHLRLDAGDIDVEVEDGEVTLSGTVDSREMKTLAEDICDAVQGVTDVTNLLRVAFDHDGQIGPGAYFDIHANWRRS